GPQRLRQPRPQRSLSAPREAAPLLLQAVRARWRPDAPAGRDAVPAARRDERAHPRPGRAHGPLRPLLTPCTWAPRWPTRRTATASASISRPRWWSRQRLAPARPPPW